ncbi:hypothetical protein TcCL_ESM09754 [Trypanosoma cruzi]|nr:hypothetical protein TcCL_ESM09754 [Trypanosoma cruzi]
MALSPSLSRGHHRSRSRTRNKKKKQKRGGGVEDRGAAVTVTVIFICRITCCGVSGWHCFLRIAFFIFIFVFLLVSLYHQLLDHCSGMPSSVLLSASLLAKLPFSVGDGGFVSAWPSDGSFCKLAVMGAMPSVCELLFDFMSLWGCCSCCTGTVSSGLDCPFTRACVESPSVFPIVFSATSAGAFVSDDVSCGIFFSFAAFSIIPVSELSFLFSVCFPASYCTACFGFRVSSSSSLTFSNAPTPRSGMFRGILTPLSSVGLTVEDALLSEGLFQL